jgi:hypothetical protein
MIRLDFQVDDREFRDDAQQDPLSATAAMLEETYFLTPVRFSVHATELLAPSSANPWLPLPLLGFATHLHAALTTIADGAEATISIGGGGSLQLRRRDHVLEIESPFARATVRASLEHVLKAAEVFPARVRELIDEYVPDFNKHSE